MSTCLVDVRHWRLAVARLALVYGVTAGIASFGVWQMRKWKGRAFLAWVAAVAALMMWFIWASPATLVADRWSGTALVVMLAGLLAVMYLYVERLPASS